MTELVTLEQANSIMLAVLAAAPIVGLILGIATKRVRTGLAWGIGVGVGNFILWRVYNAVTDRLGLDTVKNLLVNLCLFIVVGLIGGILAGRFSRRSAPDRTQD